MKYIYTSIFDNNESNFIVLDFVGLEKSNIQIGEENNLNNYFSTNKEYILSSSYSTKYMKNLTNIDIYPKFAKKIIQDELKQEYNEYTTTAITKDIVYKFNYDNSKISNYKVNLAVIKIIDDNCIIYIIGFYFNNNIYFMLKNELKSEKYNINNIYVWELSSITCKPLDNPIIYNYRNNRYEKVEVDDVICYNVHYYELEDYFKILYNNNYILKYYTTTNKNKLSYNGAKIINESIIKSEIISHYNSSITNSSNNNKIIKQFKNKLIESYCLVIENYKIQSNVCYKYFYRYSAYITPVIASGIWFACKKALENL